MQHTKQRGTYDVRLVIGVDVLRNNTKSAAGPSDTSERGGDQDLPNGGDPDLGALGVVEEVPEELEEALEVGLKALDDGLEHGEENVDADFAVHSLWRHASLLDEGKEVRPVVERNLNRSDGGDDPCRRMPYKVTARRSEQTDTS